jgi:predicted HTH transcriptional regulator
MMKFEQPIPDDPANQWRYQLDQFVEENQEQLAALMWGLLTEWGEDSQEILGIDLKPQPHFICCSREALDKLNRKVNHKIQEMLGIIDRYNPSEEVAIVAIGDGQVKLIYFQPDPSPPECFDRLEIDLDTLIQQLEQKMLAEIQSFPT